ncbi:hypothetical protein [uncultured Gemella sp.]|uniref:hypothetical protein n=1 Tax=uncultured Gemella sp. TaxID=254352 RepID=UPI0028D0E5CF|nr:hypothetical protein [uncultured Gemella sp.]
MNFSLGKKTETILISDIDRFLALVADAKPKETPTENENSTTLNSEKEVSDNEETTSSNKNNTEKETTTNNTLEEN